MNSYNEFSDKNLDEKSNRIWNKFQNQFWNQFGNQFSDNFGIDSRKKAEEFLQKYPRIYDGILAEIILEYLAENPQVMVEIFGRFLKRIG